MSLAETFPRFPRLGAPRLDGLDFFVARDPAEQVAELVRGLPPDQRYEITHHDPPTAEGFIYTVQLIGPPAIRDGHFVGWEALRR